MIRRNLVLLLLLVTASCAGPKKTPQASMDRPKAAESSQATQTTPQPTNPAITAPPAGAQYTIFCARIPGDMHVETANRMKNELIASTGMKDWYAIHNANESLLYYGYYRTIHDPKDPKESARAQADRTRIDAMTDRMGNRPFRQAVFIELTAPDPAAPPEWDLTNAKGKYSLKIAVYMDSPQRKEAAVEAVRAAREQRIQAYYYHGETASLVCVGVWPAEAVRITEEATPGSGDPEQPFMVVPQTNDPELNRRYDALARQGNVRLVKRVVQIVDPTLQATMQQYPHMAINGEHIKRIVDGREQFDPSELVPIPERSPTTAMPPAAYEPANRPTVTEVPQPQEPARQPQPAPPPAQKSQPKPGVGRLKSIGE